MNQIEKEENTKALFLKMLVATLLIFIGIIVFSFSLKSILSFFAGAVISFINLYWIQKIVQSLAKEGRISSKNGLSMAFKVLFVFGSITILILKTPINLLIFILGLSILPVVIFFDSFVMIIKHFGGK
jgi:uncharacterized membrane protein